MKLSLHDNTGELFTLDEFVDMCHRELFIDYDGFGHLSTDTHESNEVVWPSQIAKGATLDPKWTHVKWFNR